MSWTRVDSSSFGGTGNQTIFALAAADGGLVAGGGDSSLIPVDTCCYYTDGIALWRSSTASAWERADVSQPPYGSLQSSVVVGLRGQDRDLEAVISGNRTATSHDGGRTWTVAVISTPIGPRAVHPPSPNSTLQFGGRLIANTAPTDFCADCTQGALATSTSGHAWKNVTPRFPCGQRQTRPNYGFVSKPVAIASSVAVLGGCGPNLMPFNETLLAVSNDAGRHWRIERLDHKTGTPLAAVAGHSRIVTLTYNSSNEGASPVRAVTVRE